MKGCSCLNHDETNNHLEMNKETPFRSKFIRRVGNMKSRIPSSNALLMSNIVDGKSNNDEGNESLDKDLSIESEVTGNNNPDTNSKLQEMGLESDDETNEKSKDTSENKSDQDDLNLKLIWVLKKTQ